MDQRTEYLFQILDKIGGPLVAAIAHGAIPSDSQNTNPEASAREEAQTIAQLLARCVQMSIEIGRVMDLDMTDSDTADRKRLALMVLAGPLIAGQYRHDGRVPGDAEQKKIMTGLEAVLTFSQNFSSMPGNTAELAGSADDAGGTEIVKAMRHFTPVVNAIGAFPFGQPEKKLIQDVSSKISIRAEELAQSLLPGAEVKAADKLMLVKTLAEIYAECHAEQMRLMLSKSQDEPDVQQGLDNVWIRFNIRAAMLEALAAGLLPQGQGVPSAESGMAIPAAPVPVAMPPVEAPARPSPPPAGFNPMAMFGKKDEPEASVGPSPVPSEEPILQAVPEPPPELPPDPPPPQDTKKDDGEGGSGTGGSGGSPMSFFKK